MKIRKLVSIAFLTLFLTSCGNNLPNDFVQFKKVVKKRQETAKTIRDYKSVSWKLATIDKDDTITDISQSRTLEPIFTEYIDDVGAIDESKITDYDKYSDNDKKALSVLQSWRGLYDEIHVSGSGSEDDRKPSYPLMTLIENSYTLDGSYIKFKFKGVVDDRIATDEISKVTYYTSDTEAKIIHRNTNSLAFNKRIYIYNIDNLISSYQTDYYANNLLISFTWNNN